MADPFFVLSGFVMCHVYGRSFERRVSRANVRTVIVARFARISPLHLITRAGGAVDPGLGATRVRRRGDWSYALYMIHVPLIQRLFLLLMVGAIATATTETELALLMISYLAVTIGLSSLVRCRLERPLRNALTHWLSPAAHDGGTVSVGA
jgi:peptidoglycan/LPS O-acetylase OafA/YrhL